MHAVLRLCDSGRLRCSEKTRRPAAATVVEVAKTLSAGDFYPDVPIAVFAWPLLVQAGGLAEIAGGKLQLPRTAGPPEQTGRQHSAGAVAIMAEQGLIDEFSRAGEHQGPTCRQRAHRAEPTATVTSAGTASQAMRLPRRPRKDLPASPG